MRLKQRKRGRSVTVFLVSLGVPPCLGPASWTGVVLRWRRMARSPQACEAMSNRWFRGSRGSSASPEGIWSYNTEGNRRIRTRMSGGLAGRPRSTPPTRCSAISRSDPEIGTGSPPAFGLASCA